MANESKRPICPNCGKEAKCFHNHRDEWFSRFDIYTLWCPHCNYQTTEARHGGYIFFVWSICLATTCPFCGKSPNEHAKGASFKEILASLEKRREEVSPDLDPEADICPECGKGEVVCSYLGDRGTARNRSYVWEHTCTCCGYDRNFTEFREDEDPDHAEFVDQRGPGKAGGCPGPHK